MTRRIATGTYLVMGAGVIARLRQIHASIEAPRFARHWPRGFRDAFKVAGWSLALSLWPLVIASRVYHAKKAERAGRRTHPSRWLTLGPIPAFTGERAEKSS